MTRLRLALDPDSLADANALSDALCASMCKQDPEWDRSIAHEIHAHMRTALRSLANQEATA